MLQTMGDHRTTACAFVLAAALPALGQTTIRVSVAPSGGDANGISAEPWMSDDGRFVAFTSSAWNLVPNDLNGADDVFVRDLATGETTRVSVDSSGREANGHSGAPFISSDGRYVAFTSSASNLVEGDTNGVEDVFVRDLASGATSRASVDSAGRGGSDGSGVGRSWLSSDGRFVAFRSIAANLGVPLGSSEVFVHDRQTRATVLVSGEPPMGGFVICGNPSISADGRFVCFDSTASNLVASDGNGVSDAFVRDLETGVTTRASLDSSGRELPGRSYAPVITADGRWVVFTYESSYVVPGSPRAVDVVRRDLVSGETTNLTSGMTGRGGNRDASFATISADGRYVAFQSDARSAGSGEPSGVWETLVHDLATGSTMVASTGVGGASGDGDSGYVTGRPFVSRRGRSVAFQSFASNLVSDDRNGFQDVFVRDILRPTVHSLAPTTGSEAGGDRVTILGADLSAIDLDVRFGSAPATVRSAARDRIVVDCPPGFGQVPVVVTTADGTASSAPSFAYVPPELAARYGHVGQGGGDRENVLLVNALVGDELRRETSVPANGPISIAMTLPTSRTSARFALYAWRGAPTLATLTPLPRGAGSLVFPAPFTGGGPQPAAIWNNFGFEATLGAPTLASQPAPSLVVRRAAGVPRPLVATLQGLIEDSASLVPQNVSVTNAIVLRVVP
jgi:Tol biopolymer transport system component